MVNDGGPETFVQEKIWILLSGSEDPFPLSVTVLAGRVMVWSDPALAIGGLLTVEGGPTTGFFLQDIKSKIIVTADKKNFFIIIEFDVQLQT